MSDQIAVPRRDSPLDPSQPDMLDRFATWALGTPATVILGAVCIVMMVFWATNYVFWPMFNDADQMAMLAHDWDLGYKPYRDRFNFQFPGVIYPYWVVGKVAGWGNTVANHTLDASFVAAFGVWMVAWSRRVLGRALPGMLGFATFINFYFGLDYSLTNQRDWHVALYCALALTIPQFWKGRPGRLLSAAVMGWTLSNRPQALMVFPALAVVGDMSARDENGPWSKTVWAAIEYLFVMTAVFFAFLIPIFAQNLVGDFLAIMKQIGPGSNYSKFSGDFLPDPLGVVSLKIRYFSLIFGAVLVMGVPTANRRLGLALALALIGFGLYGWISPMRLPYHKLPMIVMWSLWIAYLTHLLLSYPRPSRALLVALLFFPVVIALDGKPQYASWRYALRTIAALRKGEQPPLQFSPFNGSKEYPFEDYYAAIAHIKKNSTANTKVANMTIRIYEGIYGSTGRTSAVSADVFMLFFFPEQGEKVSKELEAADDAMIMWDPNFKQFRELQPGIVKALETYYSPDARFGLIEVWRRNGKAAVPELPRS